MSSYVKYTQTKNNVIYLQFFDEAYLTISLLSRLILTHMSWLQPGKWAFILYILSDKAITILMSRLDVVDLWIL